MSRVSLRTAVLSVLSLSVLAGSVLAGCNAEALAPGADPDGGANPTRLGDAAPQGSATDLAVPLVPSDLSLVVEIPDLATPGTPVGGMCMSTCDCMPGVVCFRGTCTAPPMGPIYCCDSPTCPNGGLCVSQSGKYGRCPSVGGNDGGPNNTCMTACDCPAGLACFQGQCIKSQFGALYCCESMNCPAGSFCQSMNGGRPTRCGGGGPGGSDGGAPGYCMFVPCRSDQGCKAIGCGACDPKSNHCN